MPLALTINDVFPWGRSFDEYRLMFSLADQDLAGRILSCADGPAGFNARMHQRGRPIISVDPLYQFSADQIRQRIEATCPRMLDTVQRNPGRFVWTTIESPEHLLRVRMSAMDEFLGDFPAGRRAGRYIPAALPHLPFADRSFDLALCSHFLFLYTEQFSLDFHLSSMFEMLRIAREVRIFPLIDLENRPSGHLEPVLSALRQRGYTPSIDPVRYEFQRGADQMLRISSGVRT